MKILLFGAVLTAICACGIEKPASNLRFYNESALAAAGFVWNQKLNDNERFIFVSCFSRFEEGESIQDDKPVDQFFDAKDRFEIAEQCEINRNIHQASNEGLTKQDVKNIGSFIWNLALVKQPDLNPNSDDRISFDDLNKALVSKGYSDGVIEDTPFKIFIPRLYFEATDLLKEFRPSFIYGEQNLARQFYITDRFRNEFTSEQQKRAEKTESEIGREGIITFINLVESAYEACKPENNPTPLGNLCTGDIPDFEYDYDD